MGKIRLSSYDPLDIETCKARIQYDKIDSNIVGLVRALNSIDGLLTLGSCGGHANPRPGQMSEGDGLILFAVERNQKGWRALDQLASVAECGRGNVRIDLHAEDKGHSFTLWWHEFDPAKIEKWLQDND